MTEKVKIPQSVADAYTDLEAGWSLTDIFKMVTADFTVSDSRVQTLVDWNESGRCDEGAGLMQLLLGQYEVELEYKVGDWVTVINHEDSGYVGITAIVKDTESLKNMPIALDFDEENQSFRFDEIRHATPEEIKAEKERRIFAKIGRKIGEFRDGDVGWTVQGIVLLSHIQMKSTYDTGDLKGFYPAESFITFRDGDEDA